LQGKCQPYPLDLGARLSGVFAGIDTQSDKLATTKYWIYVVRGWCENGDSYLLDCGTANTLAALEAELNKVYFGHRILLRLVDQGGFDNRMDLIPFVAALHGWMTYKGENVSDLKGLPLKVSDTDGKLILADAKGYKVQLLDAMFGPPRPDGYVWRIPESAPKEYLAQLAAYRPNTRADNGDAFVNWKPFNDERCDYFDAEKMARVAFDVFQRLNPPDAWPRTNVPLFRRLEIIQEIKRRQAAAGRR
jgi:hypothetical protein